ncbi:MAG: very short patch repair endonuclease [Clostridiales Family XIII bacterium]|jgi:DNA mismatch endonuclease (patch repair protein)|nr:very short patch repair endonuclease [Clostridiales Family XIII bacterium]
MKRKKPDTRSEEEKRSYTMSRIRGKATSIEVQLQKALWHRGVRYRKNYRKVPGNPDIAIVRHRIAIFCDGEFWHGKDWDENRAKLRNNRDYWINKIERNMERDERCARELRGMGWRVLRFWGDEIKRDLDRCVEAVLGLIAATEGGAEDGSLYGDFIGRPAKPLIAAEEEDRGY